MTDIKKLYKRKPTLYIWTLFGIGIILFMYGTVKPTIDPAINYAVLTGEIFFASGIIIGAILLVRMKKR